MSTVLHAQNEFYIKFSSQEEFFRTVYNQYREAHRLKCDTTQLLPFEELIFLENLYAPALDENGEIIDNEGDETIVSETLLKWSQYNKIAKRIEKLISKSDQLHNGESSIESENLIFEIDFRLNATKAGTAFPLPIKVEDDCGNEVIWFFKVILGGLEIGTIDFMSSGLNKGYLDSYAYFSYKELRSLLEENGIEF